MPCPSARRDPGGGVGGRKGERKEGALDILESGGGLSMGIGGGELPC